MFTDLLLRLRSLLRRSAVEEELDDELRFHLEPTGRRQHVWHRIPFTCSYLPGKRFIGHCALIGGAARLLFTLIATGLLRTLSMERKRDS